MNVFVITFLSVFVNISVVFGVPISPTGKNIEEKHIRRKRQFDFFSTIFSNPGTIRDFMFGMTGVLDNMGFVGGNSAVSQLDTMIGTMAGYDRYNCVPLILCNYMASDSDNSVIDGTSRQSQQPQQQPTMQQFMSAFNSLLSTRGANTAQYAQAAFMGSRLQDPTQCQHQYNSCPSDTASWISRLSGDAGHMIPQFVNNLVAQQPTSALGQTPFRGRRL